MAANSSRPAARERSRAAVPSRRTSTRVWLDDGSTKVTRSVLPGGLRVVTEHMPQVRSVALGVWVGVGSVDEPESLAGATHYLEHVLFKGTALRSAMDISATIDAVGGELNAFTGKEFTCYYARVLDADLAVAVDVLGDILCRPTLARRDIEAERAVITEELAMATDDPADLVHEEFAEAMFAPHPLARPILGSAESVGSLSRQQIAGWFRRRYVLPTIVVSAAGNVDHTALVRLVRKAFAERIDDAEPAAPYGARLKTRAAARMGFDGDTPGSHPHTRLVNRRTEQAHVVLGMPSFSRAHPARMALAVVNCALGGGMSSRLFADIREQRGLAYSVFSYTMSFADSGALAVYAGASPSRAGQVIDRMRAAIGDVAEHGITADELDRAKGALRGSLVLGLEDPSSRMSRLGKSELVYPDYRSTDELLTMIDAVTLADAAAVAGEVLTREPRVAVVGPFRSVRSVYAR